MMDLLFGPDLTTPVMIFRLLVSFFAGGLIGAEREHNTSAAGLRTHILISTGATLLMLLSLSVAGTEGDPGRIAAQVVSGIGFLGAGAILRFGTSVQGLTSAASIWAVAALGLTIGAGMMIAAATFTLMTLITLITLNWLEKRFFTRRELKVARLLLDGHQFREDEFRALFKDAGVLVKNIELAFSRDKDQTMLKFLVRVPYNLDLKSLATQLSDRRDVIRFKLDQEL